VKGAAEELDLESTIAGTAKNAGWLDLHLRPERHNAVKVLLFLDVGGSMDDHIRVCEELFSACRTEFKHLEHYYFHNCVYEGVWKDNRRRHNERIPTQEVLHRYGNDYKLIFVGDASMSPYENPASRWWHRTLERGAGGRLAGSIERGFSARHLAESGAGALLAVSPVNRSRAQVAWRQHVPIDARRPGTRNASIEQIEG
jgi:hypothetical protein